MIMLLCVLASAVLLAVGLATATIALSYAALGIALVGIAIWVITFLRARQARSADANNSAAPATDTLAAEHADESTPPSTTEVPADAAEEAIEQDEPDSTEASTVEAPALHESTDAVEHDAKSSGAAMVVVIPGRRRYHQASCANLNGHTLEELTLEEAQDEGFTPCTTCAGAG